VRTTYFLITLGLLAAPVAGQEEVTECRGTLGAARVTVVRAPSDADPLDAARSATISSVPRVINGGTHCRGMVSRSSPRTFTGLPAGRFSLEVLWAGIEPMELTLREAQDTTIVVRGPATNEVRDCEEIAECRRLLHSSLDAPYDVALEAYSFHLAITLGTLGRPAEEQICLRDRDDLVPYLVSVHPAVATRDVCEEPPRDKAYADVPEIQRLDEDSAIVAINYYMARRGALWGTRWRCFVHREAGRWSVRQCVINGMA